MYHHPDIVMSHARDRQRDLIAQAQRRGVISAIRRHGRANQVARGRPAPDQPCST